MSTELSTAPSPDELWAAYGKGLALVKSEAATRPHEGWVLREADADQLSLQLETYATGHELIESRTMSVALDKDAATWSIGVAAFSDYGKNMGFESSGAIEGENLGSQLLSAMQDWGTRVGFETVDRWEKELAIEHDILSYQGALATFTAPQGARMSGFLPADKSTLDTLAHYDPTEGIPADGLKWHRTLDDNTEQLMSLRGRTTGNYAVAVGTVTEAHESTAKFLTRSHVLLDSQFGGWTMPPDFLSTESLLLGIKVGVAEAERQLRDDLAHNPRGAVAEADRPAGFAARKAERVLSKSRGGGMGD